MKKNLTFSTILYLLAAGSVLCQSDSASSLSNSFIGFKFESNSKIGAQPNTGANRLIAQVSATPEGSVAITTGSLKDTKINYSDPRSKHTRFPKYDQSQLEQAAKSPSGKLESQFSQAVKDKDTAFGGQLNSVSIAKYQALVKDGVEKGTAAKGKYFYEASFVVGVDIATGKGTKRYRLDSVPNGTHVIPYEYTNNDLK